jgi:MFS family permease
VKLIYLGSVVQGIGAGFVYPTWLGLFSTHLDRKHESFEWSLYSTLTGLGIAASAAIGALVAQVFGFQTTFVLVSILALGGVSILFKLEKSSELLRKATLTHYHHKRKCTGGSCGRV